MPTELRSATTRANGAKSRGPKSAATREISAKNSLRHGFTARNTVLLQCEDPELYKQVRDQYIANYQPATAAESDLVDEMVVARWRILRLWTIETALLDSEMTRQQAGAEKQPIPADPGIQLALAFRSLTDDSRSLATLSRYESRLHRIHERAHRTLRQLQQDRKPPEPEMKKNCQSNPSPDERQAKPTITGPNRNVEPRPKDSSQGNEAPKLRPINVLTPGSSAGKEGQPRTNSLKL